MDLRLLFVVVYLIAFTATQEEGSVCKCSNVITTSQEEISEEIHSQAAVTNTLLGTLANETLFDIADKSIQKLEKSLNVLYGNVETIIKPIEMNQEQINKTVTSTIITSNDVLFQKIEAITCGTNQKPLSNETVTEIVRKSMNTLFHNVERLIKPIAAKQELTNETVTEIVEKSLDKLFNKVETLITAKRQLLGISPSHPATSCKEILRQNKNSFTDHYWLKASNGSVVKMFCDMTRTYGGVTGGWTRVAQLDTIKNSKQCPDPLVRKLQEGKSLCARLSTGAGCSEVYYQTNKIVYNEVCGRVIGYQSGSTDGPSGGHYGTCYATNEARINCPYIDGISLTHGSPRKHIWSFLSALDETGEDRNGICDCTNKNNRGLASTPNFVGHDYFCDTGSSNNWQNIFYPNNPLWDGDGCGPNSECCTFQNPPWFYKHLETSTNDNIELRLCRDEAVTNEDVLLEKIDIYVR